jgi:hypothetical protein
LHHSGRLGSPVPEREQRFHQSRRLNMQNVVGRILDSFEENGP